MNTEIEIYDTNHNTLQGTIEVDYAIFEGNEIINECSAFPIRIKELMAFVTREDMNIFEDVCLDAKTFVLDNQVAVCKDWLVQADVWSKLVA